MIAHRSLWQLRDPRRFGSWLYAIARHRALRHVLEQRLPTCPLDAEGDHVSGPGSGQDPVQRYEKVERSRELREALAELQADLRIALELRYWNGLTMAEIAEFLSVPVSTVKWRLYAAKQALERAMTKERSAK